MVAHPKARFTAFSEKLGFAAPPELAARIQEAAEQGYQTKSEFFRSAIIEKLARAKAVAHG
jgi:hypothetical protein